MKTSRSFQIMGYEDSQLSTLIQGHGGSKEGHKQVVHVRELMRFELNIILFYSAICLTCATSELVTFGSVFHLCKQICLFTIYFSDSESRQMSSVYLVLKYKCLESQETAELRFPEAVFCEN